MFRNPVAKDVGVLQFLLQWPYSRQTGLVIFAQRQEEEMGILRPSGFYWKR